MSKKSSYRGEVRELSYDPAYARPRGQTAEDIALEAVEQEHADRNALSYAHKPKPDRFYLLRFLGLDAARYIKHGIGQGQA